MRIGSRRRHRTRGRRPGPAVALVLALAVTACGGPPASQAPPAPQTPQAPQTSQAPQAELLQFSHDAARGRFQVYLDNPSTTPLEVSGLRYDDERLGPALEAGRLRTIPAGSWRGFPVSLPEHPDCALGAAPAPSLTLRTPQGSTRLEVADPTRVVARYLEARCLQDAVDRVTRLGWAPRLAVRGEGTAVAAYLVLASAPQGGRGTVVIEDVTGTHLFRVGEPRGGWGGGVRRVGTGAAQRLLLPLRAARCDVHGFAEGGNGTAFRVHVRAGGLRGSYALRMSPEQTADAIAFAQESCGVA